MAKSVRSKVKKKHRSYMRATIGEKVRSANIDAASKRGRTALHAAARAGHLALARVLVDAGASLLLKDLTERRADEMIPPERAADGAWLVEATKAARGKPSD